MATTTIRVDTETHAALVQLCAASGSSLMDTVRDATEALSRQRFGERVARELDVLREDEAAWSDYLAAAESTHVSDGIA